MAAMANGAASEATIRWSRRRPGGDRVRQGKILPGAGSYAGLAGAGHRSALLLVRGSAKKPRGLGGDSGGPVSPAADRALGQSAPRAGANRPRSIDGGGPRS